MKEFIKSNSIFADIHTVRCLDIIEGTEETYVLECAEWKGKRTTYVFCFNCGYFYECRTETNTFEKYVLRIPMADYAEYTTRDIATL